MVRAKFYVQSITHTKGNKGAFILLQPVIGGSEENKQFYEYTPGGKIELSTVNEEAVKQFELGKEYYIDFSPAE